MSEPTFADKAQRSFKILLWTVAALLLASYATCSAYFLPSTEKVHITGIEVKRLDAKDGSILHDVRYVQARKLDGESLVFRNEDTRWGFPPYFKFNAADLASDAANAARAQPEDVFLVTYYGIRSQLLDTYPNLVAFEKVDREHVPVPIFNVVFVLVTAVLAIVAVVWTRRRIAQLAAWWTKVRTKNQPAA